MTESLNIGRNGDETGDTTKHGVCKLLPSFPSFCDIGEVFTKWSTGSAGGCKKDRAAQQIVTRCFKFLRFCCEDEEELTFEVVDFNLACVHQICCFSLSTTYKTNASSDTVGVWVT